MAPLAREARELRPSARGARRGRDPRVLHVPHDAPGRAAAPAVGPRGHARPRQREGRPPRQAHHRAGQRRLRDRRSGAPDRAHAALAAHRAARDAHRARRSSCSTRRTPSLAFASRAGGAFAEEEAFRRLLVQRMCGDMDLAKQPPDELRHLHHEYRGQSYLVSYWQRGSASRRARTPRCAWHDTALPGRRLARPRPHREGRDARALLGGGRAEPRERGRRGRAHHLRAAAPERRVHRGRALPDDALRLAPAGLPERERRADGARARTARSSSS